jgi:hypothetical protein
MGGSLGPALGAAVIGDIFKLEGRGGAMGVCFAASKLLFMIFGCLTWFQLIRLACLDQFSLLTLQVHSFFFAVTLGPPTSLKNGCSGWITHTYSWRAVHVVFGLLGLIVLTTIYFFFPETIEPGATGIDKMKAANGIDSSTSFIFINPFKSLWLLRSPSMILNVRFLHPKAETRHKSLITSKGHYNICISIVFFW